MNEEKVYQIDRMRGDQKVETVAITSKQSAQKLIAQLSEQYLGSGYKYRVKEFTHPNLPGMDR